MRFEPVTQRSNEKRPNEKNENISSKSNHFGCFDYSITRNFLIYAIFDVVDFLATFNFSFLEGPSTYDGVDVFLQTYLIPR